MWRKSGATGILAVFSLSLACLSAVANDQPSAASILNRCAAAMGTPSKDLELIAEGQITDLAENKTRQVVMKTHGRNAFRQELRNENDTDLVIINQGRGTRSKRSGRQNISLHTTAYYRPEHIPAFVCAADHAADNIRVTLEGIAEIGDRGAYHLKLVALPKGKDARADEIAALLSEYHLFIDQQTFVLLKTSRLVFASNALENRSTWDAFYQDYRNVSGVLMPFKVANYLSGTEIQEITFSAMRTDAHINDREFE